MAAAQFTEADFFIRYLAQEAGVEVAVLRDLDARPPAGRLGLVFYEDAFVACDAYEHELAQSRPRLAGCVGWTPRTDEVVAASNGAAKVLTSNRNLLVIADVLAVNKGFAKQHPDIVGGLVHGELEGKRRLRDEQAASLGVVAQAFGWSEEEAREELANVHLANLPENRAFFLKNVGGPDYWRANGLGGAGHLARQQGDFEQAKKLHERSLEIFRALGDRLGAARQLNALGEIARYVGDYDRSIELHEESLSLRYEIDDKEGIAVSLRQLGVIARDRGQYQNARMLLEESLKLELELGDKIFVVLALNDLGLVAESLCEFEKAISLFQEAMSMQLDLKDKLGISNSLQNHGNAAKDQGDFKRADLLYKECLTLKKELGDKRGISGVIAALGEIAFRQGKYSLAAELVGQSLTVSKELGLKRGVLNSLGLLGFITFYQGDYKRAAALADEAFTLATKIDAPRAIGYTQILRALGKYSEGNLEAAREKFQGALAIFAKINDRRSIALTYVNLARTAYRQGESGAAMRYLDLSLAISGKLNIRWTHGFVLEIMGLVQRSFGNYERALELFQESLHLSVEQENQQGIANCLGALAGLAVMAGEPRRAARLFAAAAKLRREMGAKMSSNDRHEYEQYQDLVHEKLDHAAFEVEWLEGFSMTTEQIIKDLKEWSVNFSHDSLPPPTEMHEINVTAFMGGFHLPRGVGCRGAFCGACGTV